MTDSIPVDQVNDYDVEVLDEISHCLLRPGRYIGAVTPHTAETYVVTEANTITKQSTTWNQGFIKLFDEIVSNSVDEAKRNPKLNKIQISVNRDTGCVVVSDNGGIPVVVIQKHNAYMPEIIFGRLRSGTNFKDKDDSVVTGQNGEGATLVNIFSKEFTVVTCDGTNSYSQTWSGNMRSKTEPVIRPAKQKGTAIAFYPDFDALKMANGIDDGNYTKLVKRVYDVAACNPKIEIILNDVPIKLSSFEDYIKMYTTEYSYDKNDQWKVGISHSDDGFAQVSFVNGSETSDATGTHVSYIADQIINKIRAFIKTKHKLDVKPSDIKNSIMLFIDATIVNPRYASQTKERLITEPSEYKTEFVVSEKFIAHIIKGPIIENIMAWVQAKLLAKENAALKKLNKSSSRVAKYLPPTVEKDYLVLCEGDSASGSMANVLSRKNFGFFPLKGKPLNSMEATMSKIIKNEEIQNIIKILELDLTEKTNTQISFNKGVLMATDMDLDGISIVGLLMTFFQRFTPKLIADGKIKRLRTPLVIAFKGDNPYTYFFNMQDYLDFEKTTTVTGLRYQYYKGLGTHEAPTLRKIIEKDGLDKFIVTMNMDELGGDSMRGWMGKDVMYRKTHVRGGRFDITGM